MQHLMHHIGIRYVLLLLVLLTNLADHECVTVLVRLL